MGDDESLSLGVASNTDPLSILLGRLMPVSIPKTRIPFIQQVTHQLSEKCLKGMCKKWVK